MARQNRRGANRQQQTEVSSSEGFMENLSILVMLALFVTVLYGGKLVFDQLDRPLTQVMVGGDFNYM